MNYPSKKLFGERLKRKNLILQFLKLTFWLEFEKKMQIFLLIR